MQRKPLHASLSMPSKAFEDLPCKKRVSWGPPLDSKDAVSIAPNTLSNNPARNKHTPPRGILRPATKNSGMRPQSFRFPPNRHGTAFDSSPNQLSSSEPKGFVDIRRAYGLSMTAEKDTELSSENDETMFVSISERGTRMRGQPSPRTTSHEYRGSEPSRSPRPRRLADIQPALDPGRRSKDSANRALNDSLAITSEEVQKDVVDTASIYRDFLRGIGTSAQPPPPPAPKQSTNGGRGHSPRSQSTILLSPTGDAAQERRPGCFGLLRPLSSWRTARTGLV